VTTATSHATATSPALATGPAISLRGLVKRFDDVCAVDGVDLDIARGEFFSMLGPSGSGKTTVLRLIGGFEKPTSGTIELDGTDVTSLAPFERNLTTVFQDYALFPHMNVLDNVAYGLRVRGVARTERQDRAAEALTKVALRGMEKRRPAQLSGGQRQRVALARALVVDPAVLLLDEPLGALDLKLREHMQVELKQIQRDVGITFVFVTHDQEEALTMSDRVAVFDHGRIQQVGSPQEIYERPGSRFVAGFVGTSNLLSGRTAQQLLGREGTFTVRPEKVRIAAVDAGEAGDASGVGADGEIVADGTVAEVVYAGPVTRYLVDLDAGDRLTAVLQNSGDTSGVADRGDRVRLLFARKDCRELADEPTGAHSSGTDTTVGRNGT
jgi:putative spermidine/putrescine transport system ATP-binding protein